MFNDVMASNYFFSDLTKHDLLNILKTG